MINRPYPFGHARPRTLVGGKKNHWRRDATRWREDRGVRRKPRGAKNLALLRGAILALIRTDDFDSLNVAFDHYTEKRAEAIRLLTHTPPQCL